MRRGLGLLELVVAMSLISLVLLLVLNLFPQALATLSGSETRLQAQRLARGEIEKLLAGSFASMQPRSAKTGGYSVQTRVDPVTPTLARITVIVSWEERGRVRRLTEQVQRARYGG